MKILKNICVSRVFRILPVFIFYFNFPGIFAGRTIGPFVFIKNKYRDDVGLLEHEKTHVKQSYIGLIVIHSLLYFFVERYRFWAEIQAYRVQLKNIKPTDLVELSNKFALFISTRYKLGVTYDEALDELIG